MSNKIWVQSKINLLIIIIIIIINKILIKIFFESSWLYGFDEDHQTNIEILVNNVSQNRNEDFFRLQELNFIYNIIFVNLSFLLIFHNTPVNSLFHLI